MKKWILLLLPFVLLCTSCTQATSSSQFENETKDPPKNQGDSFIEEGTNSQIHLFIDEMIDSGGKIFANMEDKDNHFPAFEISEASKNALKELVAEDAMTEWKEVEIEPSTIMPPFVCVADSDIGTILFFLNNPTVDIVALDTNEDIITSAKNIGDNNINGTFTDRLQSWFAVNEISIKRIVLDDDPSISTTELSSRIMKLYCEQILEVSSINPYTVSDIEVFNISVVEKSNEKGFIFVAEYAVKPQNLGFSEWYSGEGASPLSDDYAGWLLLCREITVTYDEDSSCWRCSW